MTLSPRGAKERDSECWPRHFALRAPIYFFRPSGARRGGALLPHGLRRGLRSFGPPGLQGESLNPRCGWRKPYFNAYGGRACPTLLGSAVIYIEGRASPPPMVGLVAIGNEGRASPYERFSLPSDRVCLSSPGRACTLRISCATGRAAIRGTEVANGKEETTRASRGTQRACLPDGQSG